MKLPRTHKTGRAGFTLVELVVVVLIIAILAALTATAVTALLGKGPAAKNRSEIGQLEMAVAAFHRDFGIDKQYFPSRFVLCENYSDYFFNFGTPMQASKSQLHTDSLNFLQTMFPKLWKNNQNAINWKGYGVAGSVGERFLEGDQCLVFFLGGIPNPAAPNGTGPGVLGFSRVASDPSTAGGDRKGPYYEFDESRLALLPHASSNFQTNDYFSYLDPYKQKNPVLNNVYGRNDIFNAYVYFSSYRVRNGYNRYFNTKDETGALIQNSDCSTFAVWPYARTTGSNGQYVYPAKFQIISAGADGVFAVGTNLNPAAGYPTLTWSPTTAEAYVSGKMPGTGKPNPNTNPGDPYGKDDQANFYDEVLGNS
jgi:general secretion pathway protein G